MWQISRPPANGDSLGANLERFLNGPFVKNGLLPNGPKWADSKKNLVRIS